MHACPLLILVLLSVIEDEYNGPKLEDGKVTLEFMQHLMQTYKEQGKLHRKYAYKVVCSLYSIIGFYPNCRYFHEDLVSLK
jgi:serine/threonine-protein phosphatase 5